VSELLAPAKINLALVVGPVRPDGKHEVATVLQRISLADRVTLEPEPADELRVSGFEEDTIVRAALERLAEAAGVDPRWHVRIDKDVPVAAGLGGGSSNAAAALRLANETLREPLDDGALHRLAAGLGADVPFFLAQGLQLGEGDGSELSPLELPQDYWIVLTLPTGHAKASTAAVYEAFTGAEGFAERRAALLSALALGELAALPPNDLVSSPLADEIVELGAFRADVTGAGPTVYGLFTEQGDALRAHATLADRGQTWIATPAW
jgi:4-diphosphocytidyl-2-C-methyl-D-erythritol kinase